MTLTDAPDPMSEDRPDRLARTLLRYGAVRPWRWVDVARPVAVSAGRVGIELGAVVLAGSEVGPEARFDRAVAAWFFPRCEDQDWQAVCARAQPPASRALVLAPGGAEGWRAHRVEPDGSETATTAAERRLLAAVVDSVTMFLAPRGLRVHRARPCSARMLLPDHWDVGIVKVLTPHPAWHWPRAT